MTLERASSLLASSIASAGSPPVAGILARLATPQDIKQLVPLINKAYESAHWFKKPHFYDRVHAEYLESVMKTDYLIVLEETKSVGRLVASIRLVVPSPQESPKHCGMSLLAIHPDLHRRGLAKYLFKLLCGVAIGYHAANPDAGWDLMQCEVVSLQPHLIEIYTAWGFKIVGMVDWEAVGFSKDDVTIPCCLFVLHKRLAG
ncbi:hypothetical protein BC830DRAFT_1109711 [Chytriomyces sp. MP71]|nr:hypothetical protein BC830DRAFT_1109711 [Chytriomyces sp. MP71]